MHRRAFTLVELLVVISIIGLMSAIAVVSMGSAKVNARNTRRKADLVQISKALELFYTDNGAYPNNGGWLGSCPSYDSRPNTGGTAWIPSLAPTYMSILPTDPTQGKNNSSLAFCNNNRACYLYASDGIDYKVMAFCTPEGPISTSDPFYDPNYSTSGFVISTPGGRAKW
jgi:prepilin-type N-terminal cleavage/methylation domain-containing protein